MGDMLQLHVEPKLDEPILILAFEGWNDAGDSATSAAKFLHDSLLMAPLAEIDGEDYYDFTVQRPTVSLAEDQTRRIDWPAYRFSYGSVQGRCDVVVGQGSEPHTRWRGFCDDILDLSEHLGVGRVVLLGAYLADVLYTRPVRVSGFADPPEMTEAAGVETSGYEGPTGIVGVLAERFAERGIPVLSLWAALPHYITLGTNPRGALALIQTLVRHVDLPVDQDGLLEEAAEFENRMGQQVAADPALAEYVRELKKREFAQ